eukprot:4990879-Prorocentrum_lima.AAC.1
MTSFQKSAADWIAKTQNAWRTTFLQDLGGEQLCFSVVVVVALNMGPVHGWTRWLPLKQSLL